VPERIMEVTESVPYKCPVCNGTGKVPRGFYKDDYGAPTLDGYHEYCRSCNGSGIVFGAIVRKTLIDKEGN
jgi:DnaJ-class molecular chaperone